MSAEDEKDRIYTDAVEKIWKNFDDDHSGELDKEETRNFLKTVLENCPPPNNYDESKFEATFIEIDTNGDGMVDKQEMITFIKKLMIEQKASGSGQPAQHE